VLAHQLPRLLYGTPGTPLSLVEHEEAFTSTTTFDSLLHELEASGLTGRGGAGFPTARKARLLREQHGHHKVVVVNAMEGEPASHKDATLLSTNPHLVIDGAEALASIIGAKRVVLCVARDNSTVVNHVKRALHERERRGRRGPDLELQTPPWRYVAGEESALVHWLNDNESLPQYRPRRPNVLTINRRPVLLDNAETCANVGLIARFGANWFRSLGTRESTGSMLVSLTGAVAHPTVLEVIMGTPLRTILDVGGADAGPQALLLGGYGGSWLSAKHLDTPYHDEALRPLGASVGAGVIVVLGHDGCGLVETQRVVKWMANESARQCGPCAFGLPALGENLAQLSNGSRDRKHALRELVERCGVINGRGACHHPDGVVRFVRSALEVFANDVANHVNGTPCRGATSSRHFARVPALEHEDALVWE
jgi:NADH:ubiquinone oxidoreductase subunit F (NADH-binding)